MKQIKHQTAQFMGTDKWMFFRPQNADISKNLQSAFVPVNPVVGADLHAGQHYMGGIAYQVCTTEWFFDGLGEMTESVGGDVAAAFRNWFEDGIKAEQVFEEVKYIVIMTAMKLNFQIDVSMTYSIMQEYLTAWVNENKVRAVEDPEENPEINLPTGDGKEQPSGRLSVKMPTFELKVEKYLVHLLDEDDQTLVIWYWRTDLEELEPRSELYRNNNGFDPDLINLQMAHARVEIVNLYIRRNAVIKVEKK